MPSSFIIYLERIMDGIQEMALKRVIVHGRNISNLKFTDDTDLLDKPYERLQNQLQKLDEDSRRYGMRINIDKMCPAGPFTVASITPSLKVRDLGVMVDSDLSLKAHVHHVTAMCAGH